MARGWLYTQLSLTLSLSSALFLSFSGMIMYFVLLFLSFCRFFFLLSLELCRCSSDLSCPADHVQYRAYWQPRILLGMVEARWVNG